MRDMIRAILVSLHCFAVFAMSCPAPAGMNEKTLQDEHLQPNFRDWAATAQEVGIDLTAEDIQDLSWTWGRRVLAVRKTMLAPFKPYYTYLGTRQSWQMFGYLNRSPGRIEVATCDELQKKLCTENSAWEWRFIMLSDEADWLRDTIEQERMRAIVSSFAWKKSKSRYNTLGNWLAKQAARDFPEARYLRTRMGTLLIPEPDRLSELGEVPVGEWYWERTIRIPEATP